MKNTTKRILALLLSLCMLTALTVSAFAQGIENYLMIGDSISIYCGTDTWSYNGTYSAKLKDDPELGINSLKRLAHPGWGVQEGLLVLGGPDYTNEVGRYWSGQTSVQIRGYSPTVVGDLAEADLITIQLGANNILGTGVGVLRKAFEQDGFQFNGSCVDRQIIACLDRLEDDLSDTEALIKLLNLLETTERGMVLLKNVLKIVPSTITEFQKSWDALMERIYEVNPDAKVVVIGIYNPVGMILKKTINDNLDLDEKLQPLLDSTEQLIRHTTSIFADALNLYMRSGSRYARQYVYVDVTEVDLTGTMDGSHLGAVGHQYFYEKIKNAIVTHYLPESVPATKTTPTGLLGKLVSGLKKLF